MLWMPDYKDKQNRLNTLITDWDASEEDLCQFDDLGIEVVIVDKE